jgi:hypothetical protein
MHHLNASHNDDIDALDYLLGGVEHVDEQHAFAVAHW